MPEQHVQLLKGLGYNDEQIKAVEEMTPEQLKEWKPDELITAAQTNMKNVLSNDATFLGSIPEDKINKDILKKIESGQYARFQNELIEVATKKLGLDDKEVLTAEDRKSIKAMTAKIAEAYAVKTGNVDGLKKMQTELSEAQQSLERMKGEHETNLKTELEKVNGTNSAKFIKMLTKVELAGLDDVQLSVAAGFISDPVLQAMSSKYTIVLDANDNLDIKQKDNANLDVLDKGGKKISFKAAMREEVLTNKLGVEIKEDPKNPGGKKKVVIDEGGNGGAGGGDKGVPSYIQDKIDNNPETKAS